MQRHSRAWILIPGAILGLVAIGLIVSNLQVECGLMKPEKGQRAAAAAFIGALELSSGESAEDYAAYSHALLAATVAHRNAALTNPADTRVRNLLAKALDCLTAVREAWQAEIESAWDPQSLGSPVYWNGLHPAVDLAEDRLLTSAEVRRAAATRASEFVDQAIDLLD